MSDCLFCKIINGEIPAEIVYEDDQVLAFKDIQPSAPHHYLVVPRRHIDSLNQADESWQQELGRLFVAARKLAESFDFADSGYRCIVNTNAHAGQEIFHVHLHVLAGRPLGRMVC